MISADVDNSAAFAGLDRLTSAVNKGVRPAAQAGAQVFYDEVRIRVPVSAKPHKSGKKTYTPGTLRKAIYQAFADGESNATTAAYRISWNKQHAFYGKFVEGGTSKMAANPFLRPAYDAAEAKAVKATNALLAYVVRNA